MNVQLLLAFTLGMIVLSASPGPGVLASVSKALSEGFKSSLLFIAGLVLGDILFFLLALVGMSSISIVMGQFFFIVKICGGLYLIYLGIKTIRERQIKIKIDGQRISAHKSFLSGFLVTLGNPKPILFYASIVPTLIDVNQLNIIEVAAIVLIIVLVSFGIIGTYCYVAVLSKSICTRERYQRQINTISGLVMIVAGSFVLLKKS